MPTSPLPLVYMDSGTAIGGEDWCAVYTGQILDEMVASGFEEDVNVTKYIDKGGAHSETYWGPRFHLPLSFLYSASGVPVPPK